MFIGVSLVRLVWLRMQACRDYVIGQGVSVCMCVPKDLVN